MLKTKQELKKEKEELLPEPPPLPEHLKYKYTEKEWRDLHLSKVRHDAKKRDIVEAWERVRDLTNNFTKDISNKDLTSQEAIAYQLLIPRKGMRTQRTPERIFRNYLESLLANDVAQIHNLTNYIKFDFVKTDKYLCAIDKRLDSAKDKPFIE